jgi:hypothetical protein
MRFAPTEVRKAPKCVREWQILEPSPNDKYTSANKTCTINIPAFGIMDLLRGFFTFNAKFTSTGANTYRRCHNGIWNIIKRITIAQAGQGDIEIAPEYGKVAHLQYIATREVDVDSYIGNSLWGIGSGASRSAAATGASYAIPLVNGFMSIDPIDITKLSGQLAVTIEFADPRDFMEADAGWTALDYEVTNVQFFVEKLNFLSDSVESRAIRSRNLWKIVSWRQYLRTPGLAQEWTLDVDHKTNSVDSFIVVMNTTADMTNPTINDRLETFIKNNTTSYQPIINGIPVPARKIDCVGMAAYVTFLSNIGKWMLRGVFTDTPVLTKANYDTNKFITMVDLRSFPSSPQLVNPVSFADASTSLSVQFTASAAPAAAFNVYTYVFYEQLVSLDNGFFKVAF